MTQEQAEQIISDAGFAVFEVLPPSKETRGKWFIRVKTELRGYKLTRIAGDAIDPASQLAAWLAGLPAQQN